MVVSGNYTRAISAAKMEKSEMSGGPPMRQKSPEKSVEIVVRPDPDPDDRIAMPLADGAVLFVDADDQTCSYPPVFLKRSKG